MSNYNTTNLPRNEFDAHKLISQIYGISAVPESSSQGEMNPNQQATSSTAEMMPINRISQASNAGNNRVESYPWYLKLFFILPWIKIAFMILTLAAILFILSTEVADQWFKELFASIDYKNLLAFELLHDEAALHPIKSEIKKQYADKSLSLLEIIESNFSVESFIFITKMMILIGIGILYLIQTILIVFTIKAVRKRSAGKMKCLKYFNGFWAVFAMIGTLNLPILIECAFECYCCHLLEKIYRKAD